MQNGAFLCIFARFCAFLCVSARFFLPKWPAKKRKLAQNSAKMCKKRFYAIPPLVIPPFACHRVLGWIELCHEVRNPGPKETQIIRNEHPPFPQSSFPCLFGSPCLSPFQGILCDFERFSLLSQGYLGFGKHKKSCFFWWFSLPSSQKRQGKEDRVRKWRATLTIANTVSVRSGLCISVLFMSVILVATQVSLPSVLFLPL